MATTKIAIHVQSDSAILDDQTIMLGETFFKKWKLTANQSVTLVYGSHKKDVKVISIARLVGLRLQGTLANLLGLHDGANLSIRYRKSTRTLYIGPLIGVMMSRVSTKDSEKPFGANTAFCKELTDACAKYGAFIYFYTPKGITPNSQTLNGWSFSNHWNKKTFPIPNVIYNRLTTRKLENQPIVQKLMNDAKSRYGSVVFNEKYLNKTEVFEALKKEPGLLGLLPESYHFKSFAMLKSMMARHSTIFLKPITGSLGKGIIRISRLSDKSYQYSFNNTLSGMRTKNFSNLTSLYSSISGVLKHQSFQIQQGLKLIEIGGRPIDFRVLVQRNELGEWSLTSIVARTAGQHNFVSNLARGGSLSKVKDIVGKSNLNPANKSTLNNKLGIAALKIAKGIEAQVPGHFAELGIDLAADSHGKVWLIEVNSKPSKEDNTPLVENKIRPSVIKVVRYAQFLAKFS
ncbi:YheC/YheD family protein [Paenibacillus psychroresistens]|uniref:YheC/YheD family protein n=1 Tax=Paenibacillus psychroresistens TaxID=1778678 RepID=A0A6B8RQJ2_9BACL|nr:YheC/YheD family protein [Paenibacillus psychroresistens]QGQ97815.1 YheC/YheD family protein [Paenibacillus psychroresistens]